MSGERQLLGADDPVIDDGFKVLSAFLIQYSSQVGVSPLLVVIVTRWLLPLQTAILFESEVRGRWMVLATSYPEAIHNTTFYWLELDYTAIPVVGIKSNSFSADSGRWQGKMGFTMADGSAQNSPATSSTLKSLRL